MRLRNSTLTRIAAILVLVAGIIAIAFEHRPSLGLLLIAVGAASIDALLIRQGMFTLNNDEIAGMIRRAFKKCNDVEHPENTFREMAKELKRMFAEEVVERADALPTGRLFADSDEELLDACHEIITAIPDAEDNFRLSILKRIERRIPDAPSVRKRLQAKA